MNNDDFEQDLHATLEGMAREPAPDGLVSRVSRIPSRVPPRGSFFSRFSMGGPRIGPGFAAVLGVVVIALAVIVVRPALEGTNVGPSPSPSADASVIAVVPTPSPAISAPPSEAPSTTPPSSEPTPTPTPSPTPSPTSTPVVAFEPVSVTFVSSNDGWVLGTSGDCTGLLCPAVIERTTDAGQTWTPFAAPAKVYHPNGVDVGAVSAVSRLRFANTDDGWAYGPELWATHDGGATWTKLTVAGLPSGSLVVALETSHGLVHAAFYDGASNFRIASSPIGSDAWTLAAVKVAVGGGPVPAVQLVLSGGAGWLLENDRTVTGGARLVTGTWKAWTPVCADVTGPAYLAASSASDVLASCDVGLWSAATGNHLFVSHDAGSNFAETGPALPITSASSAATPNTSTIVVAGQDSKGPVLIASFNGGQSWAPVLHVSASGNFSELGFTTSSQGVVVVTSSTAGTGRLFMTHDGGHTWSNVTI